MSDTKFTSLDQFDYHHTLASTSGISLVIFWRRGCGSCNMWKSLLAQYQALHPAIHIFAVDVEQEAALVNELEIFHLPAMYLYANGDFHCELQVEAKLSKLEQAIHTALVLPATEQP